MTVAAFLDTNVVLRHVLGDNADHSPRASALFARIERGDLTVRLTDTVVFEAVFTLERLYRTPRPRIREALLTILDLAEVVLPGKIVYRTVFDLYVDVPSLSFADCYHAVLMERLDLTEIISFDRGFDRLPGITRTEPA